MPGSAAAACAEGLTVLHPGNYEEVSVIGNGAYGTVYKARDLSNPGQMVALKKVRVPLTEDGVPMSTLREIALLKQLDQHEHPNIVRCGKCEAFSNLSDAEQISAREEHNLHIINKQAARDSMRADKAQAMTDDSLCVINVDLQKVLTTPRAEIGPLYYSSKLNVYNFTIFELASHVGVCNVWNETIGCRGSNEIASMLYTFFCYKKDSATKNYIIYSDNCGGQNRNKTVFGMYIYAAHLLKINITHRLLDICHGQRMEKDQQLTLFLVFEHVEQDLSTYIERCPPPGLSEERVKYIMYQVLCGVDFLHSHRIVHRDLKPQNLLVASDGQVKLADFGLAKTYDFEMRLTSVVVTLWYRSPEVLLGLPYATPVDIWSCGCIMAELFRKSPLFSGTSEGDQLDRIFQVIGTPPESTWPESVSLPWSSFKPWPPAPLSLVVPEASPMGREVLQSMLAFTPCDRIGAAAALAHSYFRDDGFSPPRHGRTDEPSNSVNPQSQFLIPSNNRVSSSSAKESLSGSSHIVDSHPDK